MAISLVACDRAASTTTVSRSLDVRPYVTQETLATLNSDGRFDTEVPNALPYPTIAVDQARAISLAAAREFGPGLRKQLEGERGRPIDFNRLRVGRVFYGHSAYEQTLPAGFPGGYRKAAGPFYLVTLTDRGAPAMSVVVSLYDTDVVVENGGLRFVSLRHGADFFLHGIPATVHHELPLAPERAAQVAADQTGARVAGIPQLQLLGITLAQPETARWRIRLDRKIRIVHPVAGEVIETDEVFVGRDARAELAETGPIRPYRLFDREMNQWIEFRYKTGAPSAFTALSRAPKN